MHSGGNAVDYAARLRYSMSMQSITVRVLGVAIQAGLLQAAGCAGPGAAVKQGGAVVGSPGSPKYDCRPAAEPITLDGRLDEPAWQDAPFSEEFLVSSTVRTMPDKLRTRMKLLYDKDSLYVGLQTEDSDIWCTYAGHDEPVMYEKALLFNVDPLGNGRDYYGFYVNPMNALLDIHAVGGVAEMSQRRWQKCVEWNAKGIRHAVQVDGTLNKRDDVDNGWTLELQVPFDAIGVRPAAGDAWLIQAGRIDYWLGGKIMSSWTRASFGALLFR